MEVKSSASENELELVGKDTEGNFLVKHRQSGNISTIVDTYAEMSYHNETADSVLGLTPLFFGFASLQ